MLASKLNHSIAGLILMSPYTSIRGIVNSWTWDKNLFGCLIKERFRNIDLIRNVRSPILMIHGKDDKLINYDHSNKLYEKVDFSLK